MEYKFTTEGFQKDVLDASVPVLIDFYAEWCGPCKSMAPLVEQLSKEYEGKVKIGKLNIDEEMDIAQKYGVMSIPTFILFKDGKPIDTSVGAMSKDALEDKLKKVLG